MSATVPGVGTAAVPATARPPRLLPRLLRRPAAAALVFLLLCVLAALGAPWLAPTAPGDNDLSAAMQAPGGALLLGADDQGRDMATRLLFGLRLTLASAAASVLLGGGTGAYLGLLVAFRPRLDNLVMRTMDVLLSFPAILFGLAIAAVSGPGVLSVVLALSIATVPLAARIVRGAASVEMARDYIEAARAVGVSDRRLMWRHLAPNCLSALLVFATLWFGQVVILGAALSFLGLGAQPPVAELGAMAAQGRNFLFFAPHIAVEPCALIFAVAVALNVLGDALRDALDPRLST
jgi:peptide/nickel transport system permease protein